MFQNNVATFNVLLFEIICQIAQIIHSVKVELLLIMAISPTPVLLNRSLQILQIFMPSWFPSQTEIRALLLTVRSYC